MDALCDVSCFDDVSWFVGGFCLADGLWTDAMAAKISGPLRMGAALSSIDVERLRWVVSSARVFCRGGTAWAVDGAAGERTVIEDERVVVEDGATVERLALVITVVAECVRFRCGICSPGGGTAADRGRV